MTLDLLAITMTRQQVKTGFTTPKAIMQSADFWIGVADVRLGRPADFDENDSWNYERGRQWALIAPASMPLRIGGKLNREALKLLERAFIEGNIT